MIIDQASVNKMTVYVMPVYEMFANKMFEDEKQYNK